MAFDQDFLDELAARCDIVDIVSRYVQLKKSGASYFGLCPFHNEKTASFSVSPGKQIFYCFGCGAGGGVFSFIQRAEGLEFPDAVRYLARQAGMPMPEETQNPQAAHRRERLLTLMTDTARFYYNQLWASEHETVQAYFARRGLRRGTMNHFGLGYAPDSFSALLDAMGAKGYTKEELLDAGLASKSEKGSIYDRFRNRAMFPIIDTRGQVIAFGGRVMDDSKPKYLNSPETTLFHKSRNLFALNFAKKTKSDYFILAEGYMDVIALHQAGFDCAVASLGTSLTEEQARLISRYVKQIVISYDADSAGQAASQRAIDILKQADLQVRVLRIPGAKDPDEFIKAKGADAFRRLIEQSEDHNVYRLEAIAAKYDLEDDGERVQFVQDAAGALAKIDNAVEREIYTGRAAAMATISTDAMTAEVKRARAIRGKKAKAQQRREIRAPAATAQPKDRTLRYPDIRAGRAEEGIVGLLFTDNTLLDDLSKRLSPEQFTAPVLRKIYAHALALYEAHRLVSVAAFEGYLEDNELAHLTGILSEPVAGVQRRKALDDYIEIMERQRVLREGEHPQDTQEDPLLALSRRQREKSIGRK